MQLQHVPRSQKRSATPESLATFAKRNSLDYEACATALANGRIVANRDGRLQLARGADPQHLRRAAGGQGQRRPDPREYRAGDVPSVAPRDERSERERTSLSARRQPRRNADERVSLAARARARRQARAA